MRIDEGTQAGQGAGSGAPERQGGGPTWRALAVSVLVAIVLSATIALLLGGPYGRPWSTAAGEAGARRPCCAPPAGSGPVR